jgi:hypothetical protein
MVHVTTDESCVDLIEIRKVEEKYRNNPKYWDIVNIGTPFFHEINTKLIVFLPPYILGHYKDWYFECPYA